MNETLWWIATHLDCYHFNTDRGRLLKRQIQEWTTLSEPEQKAQEDKLLEQFFKLFANNPWLEQEKLVTDEHSVVNPIEEFMSKPLRYGDITGANADAYFIENIHYVLKPLVLDANGKGSFFMDFESMNRFIEYMKADAMECKQNFATQCKEAIELHKICYNYILSQQYKIGTEIKKSPSILSALSCVVYLYAFFMLLITTFKCWFMKWNVNFSIPIFFLRKIPARISLVILLLIMMTILICSWKAILNTMVKGVYRTGYVLYTKYFEKKVQKLADKVNTLDCSSFFENLQKAIEETKLRYCDGAAITQNQDQTIKLLKNTYDRTYIGELSNIRAPWKRYSDSGETTLSHLGWILVLSIIVLFII